MRDVKKTVRRGFGQVCGRTRLRHRLCWNVPGRGPHVALTFDDGPNADRTPAVLEVLAERGVVGTFFLQGNMLERQSSVLTRIVDDGHEIGHHGFSHARRDVRNQAKLGDRALRAQGISTRLFRPPGGEAGPGDLAWLAWRGYSTVFWSFDSVDSRREEGKWLGAQPDYAAVRAGDIVLMHDDNATCLRDLPVLLDALALNGLMPVTVSARIGFTGPA